MANPVISSNLNVTAASTPTPGYYFAVEYLVRRIGQEAAQRSNMPEVMWVEGLEGQSSMNAHFRFVDALTASSATEAGSLPSVAWAPEGVQVSAGLSGLSVIVSKVVNSLDPAALSQIAKQEGTALGRAVDAAAAALFATFTGTVGATTTALTVATVIAANALLDAQHADEIGPYVGRLHANQFKNLYTDIMSKNYGIAKITADVDGKEVINIGETLLKKNSLLSKANTNADWVGGIFNSEAMGLAIAQGPSIEILPIPGKASYSIDGSVAFGVGNIRPAFGVSVISGVSA
jgi:hypothetical protein